MEVGVTLGNLGSFYESLGQYTKAIEHHEEQLTVAKEAYADCCGIKTKD
jgi:hypothetical protein